METMLAFDFWIIFNDKFDELVKNYNFTINDDSYFVESITNDKYSISIDYHTHPQFDEAELSVEILDIKTNNKLYENKYLLINIANGTIIKLEEPVENFMDKFFDEIIKKINI